MLNIAQSFQGRGQALPRENFGVKESHKNLREQFQHDEADDKAEKSHNARLTRPRMRQ